MKIRILQKFIGNVDGKSVRFAPGQVAEVEDHDAEHFLRAKYAEKFVEPEQVVKEPVEKVVEEVVEEVEQEPAPPPNSKEQST